MQSLTAPSYRVTANLDLVMIIWLLHNLVEASFDLFRYLLLGDQLKPWELHPLVSYTSCVNAPSAEHWAAAEAAGAHCR